jgi:hypothetical protein
MTSYETSTEPFGTSKIRCTLILKYACRNLFLAVKSTMQPNLHVDYSALPITVSTALPIYHTTSPNTICHLHNVKRYSRSELFVLQRRSYTTMVEILEEGLPCKHLANRSEQHFLIVDQRPCKPHSEQIYFAEMMLC